MKAVLRTAALLLLCPALLHAATVPTVGYGKTITLRGTVSNHYTLTLKQGIRIDGLAAACPKDAKNGAVYRVITLHDPLDRVSQMTGKEVQVEGEFASCGFLKGQPSLDMVSISPAK